MNPKGLKESMSQEQIPRKIPGIEDVYSNKIINIFQSLPSGTDVILFGSRAKGNYREGSDIDLALKGQTVSIDDRNYWLLAYSELNFPWILDLVIYEKIEEPALKEHIDRVGKLLLRVPY